jgi:hypothetical protein
VVVKSNKCEGLLDNLKETFGNLRNYKMLLNPKIVSSVCHLAICLAIWYQLRESTLIQRMWKPLNNSNHPRPEEKFRS